jgi:hypothetical protein
VSLLTNVAARPCLVILDLGSQDRKNLKQIAQRGFCFRVRGASLSPRVPLQRVDWFAGLLGLIVAHNSRLSCALFVCHSRTGELADHERASQKLLLPNGEP